MAERRWRSVHRGRGRGLRIQALDRRSGNRTGSTLGGCKSALGALALGSGIYDPAAGEACLADLRTSSVKPEFCDLATSPPGAFLLRTFSPLKVKTRSQLAGRRAPRRPSVRRPSTAG